MAFVYPPSSLAPCNTRLTTSAAGDVLWRHVRQRIVLARAIHVAVNITLHTRPFYVVVFVCVSVSVDGAAHNNFTTPRLEYRCKS